MVLVFNELHVFADFNCAFLLTTCREVSKLSELEKVENRETPRRSEIFWRKDPRQEEAKHKTRNRCD